MNTLPRQMEQTLVSRGLLKDCRHLLVGLSGGADSVALTHALASRPQRDVAITLAHLHHGLRGPEADGDAAFVTGFADALGLPLVVEREDVRALSEREGISLEMAARRARYAFFGRVRQSVKADAVATAHTADDQVETLLLRLLRGTGARGLGGMRHRSQRGDLVVVRPLLDISRAVVLAYAQAQGLAWREDTSNHDINILRNRVRHRLLPELAAQFGASVYDNIGRLAQIMQAEDEWLETLSRARWPMDEAAPAALPCRLLTEAPLALRRRMVRQWLMAGGVREETLTYAQVEAVRALAERGAGTQCIALAGGMRVVRTYDQLRVEPAAADPGAPAFRVPLRVPGETLVRAPALRVTAAWSRGIPPTVRAGAACLPAEAWLDGDRLRGARLYLRNWEPGDRMSPLGMKGTRKLQDIFVDEKVPPALRHSCPLLACENEIVWLPGYAVANGWQVRDAQAPSVHLRAERPCV